MKVAFFVSSLGDTDLALDTIRSIEQRGICEMVLISLTQAAERHVNKAQLSSSVIKNTLSTILHLSAETSVENLCTQQLDTITQYINDKNIQYVYMGVPSVSHNIPFQIAQALEDTPVLIAYEFMFKPEAEHDLWKYLPALKSKSNVQWAFPLHNASDNFRIEDQDKVHITGHVSIDNAYSFHSTYTPEDIRADLQISAHQSLAFVSSTTRPFVTDVLFLECLLAELPNHPQIQVRFGLHPGIADLDTYMQHILSVYSQHEKSWGQFKIILPEQLLGRFRNLQSFTDNPTLQNAFLWVNISGSDAAFAADRVAQAVSGALLNQAVIEGKPAYAHSSTSYLPHSYFSNNLVTFFSEKRQPLRMKKDFGLDDKTAGEACSDVILGILGKTS